MSETFGGNFDEGELDSFAEASCEGGFASGGGTDHSEGQVSASVVRSSPGSVGCALDDLFRLHIADKAGEGAAGVIGVGDLPAELGSGDFPHLDEGLGLLVDIGAIESDVIDIGATVASSQFSPSFNNGGAVIELDDFARTSADVVFGGFEAEHDSFLTDTSGCSSCCHGGHRAAQARLP